MNENSNFAWDESSTRDSVVLDFPPNAFSLDVSSNQFEYEDRKARLQNIIDEMAANPPSWSDSTIEISRGAAETAKAFLKRLPSNRELPKVAPDGEGDVLLVWEPPQGNCIVTAQDGVLHIVDKPGTQYAIHVDDQMFLGLRIPISILHAIPMR